MADRPITSWTVRELADAVASTALSPVELAEAFLERAERSEPVVRAFAHLDPELVRRQAKQAADEVAAGRWRGPLHGVPIGVKDIVDTADMPTRYGSPVWPDVHPAHDAAVVRRVREAGAVVFGKNTTQEFAVGITCAPTANPWDPGRVAGGSSGGSAAAVAARECAASVGSDTGGSIRIPAAFCGVVGLRPTGDQVPHDGVWPASPTLDRVGPIARNADDTELLFRCLAGLPSTSDFRALDLAGVRIGVLADWLAESDDDVREVVAEAIGLLERAGARLVEVTAPAMDLVGLAYGGVALREVAERHRENAARGLLDHNPAILGAVAAGNGLDQRTLVAARNAVEEIGRAWDALFTGHGLRLLLSPTVPFTACAPADLPPLEMRAGSLTIPLSLSGLPAVSQPAGFANGLPVGVQWIGPRGSDLDLLAAARAYEELTDWHTAEPPVR
ncbi:amidase [Saccharothrix xinjiangensis]|uniref:Amidase n=1 Tax=Saccharothrix xinjiangensis TaxID=204798 RepID=A0ABV9YFT2_9PSEU